ncbi:hypothetical protein Syun_017257 [Stephania yunnanensis]|uniref:Uncharacterized protein n=1 Tax=Stephania yunnanensis TaxID=152371 RepID=A0AAP0J868_9MAGN
MRFLLQFLSKRQVHARAKAQDEAQSTDGYACFVGHEVFDDEVLANKVFAKETRSVAEPRPTQKSEVGDSNFVEPSQFSNGGGSGRRRGKGK